MKEGFIFGFAVFIGIGIGLVISSFSLIWHINKNREHANQLIEYLQNDRKRSDELVMEYAADLAVCNFEKDRDAN